MPQSSIYYAIGRLSVLEGSALDRTGLERLIQAPTAQDARRVLAEAGWPEGEDLDQVARERLRSACNLVRRLSTDPEVTNCFLLRYDARNIKTLLKARSLGEEASRLSECGTLSLPLLRRSVAERRYAGLPEVFRTALEGLEKRLAVRVDPLDIDITVDRALFAAIFAALPPSRGDAKDYFRARVDLTNGLIALRALHAGKPPDFLSAQLIPGGRVAPAAFEKAFRKPEMLPSLLKRFGPRVHAAAMSAFMDAGKLPLLEKEAEDWLTGLYRPFRRTIDREERLVSYLLLREREADAVRLVMAARAHQFPPETIQERLRELYGG